MMSSRFVGYFTRPKLFRPLLAKMTPTFSQYGEDIILRKLLRPSASGCFVDVGSHHPVEGSNTFFLHSLGWRGVSIDPNPSFADDYARYRKGDVHLVQGVSDESDELLYFAFETSVFNTFSQERANNVISFGETLLEKISIPCEPLQAIIERAIPDKAIDVLSVDCEGLDLAVLKGLKMTGKGRPTVIIVEDFEKFRDYRDGTHSGSELHDFLFSQGFRPIAQLAWSSIYVATDWRELMQRSDAFDPSRIQGGILP